ncbi:hypothetical protein YC2023_094688 [Brassica napus]
MLRMSRSSQRAPQTRTCSSSTDSTSKPPSGLSPPVNIAHVKIFHMKERAKWDAWKAVEGKSTDEAMSDYITKVKQLLEAEAAAAST